jgi:hypothetical protein
MQSADSLEKAPIQLTNVGERTGNFEGQSASDWDAVPSCWATREPIHISRIAALPFFWKTKQERTPVRVVKFQSFQSGSFV